MSWSAAVGAQRAISGFQGAPLRRCIKCRAAAPLTAEHRGEPGSKSPAVAGGADVIAASEVTDGLKTVAAVAHETPICCTCQHSSVRDTRMPGSTTYKKQQHGSRAEEAEAKAELSNAWEVVKGCRLTSASTRLVQRCKTVHVIAAAGQCGDTVLVILIGWQPMQVS